MSDAPTALMVEHYERTFSLVKNEVRRRDWLSIGILVLATIFLFQLYSPAEAGPAIADIVSTKLGLAKPLDISFIGSLIWFTLLITLMKYYQVVIDIERLYLYIHNLEKQLTPEFGHGIFTREGASYLSSFKLFRKFTHFLYTKAFPALLLLIIGWKVISEWKVNGMDLLVILNTLIFLAIVTLTVIYIYARWVEDTKGRGM